MSDLKAMSGPSVGDCNDLCSGLIMENLTAPNGRYIPAFPSHPKFGECSHDQFETLENLGNGAFSNVMKAVHKPSNEFVTLKMILPQYDLQPRVRMEECLQHRVNLPTIRKHYCTYNHNNIPVMVMEYVEGLPLMKYVKKSQPISKDQFKRWAAQLTITLMALHSHSVVFMDMNPNNIIVTNDGRDVKLIDFGLARETCFSIDGGRETFCGTPYYASPENAERFLSRSGHLFLPSSDWFALGLSLYRAATLKHLYHFKMLKCLSKRDPYFAMSKLFENICKGFEIMEEDKEGNPELLAFIELITVHDPEARLGTNMDNYPQFFQIPLFADYKSWNDFLGITG